MTRDRVDRLKWTLILAAFTALLCSFIFVALDWIVSFWLPLARTPFWQVYVWALLVCGALEAFTWWRQKR